MVTHPQAPATRRILSWFGRPARRYGAIALVLVVWWLVAAFLRAIHSPPYVLPPPSAVVSELVEATRTGVLLAFTSDSLIHLAVAAVSAVGLGLVIGLLIGLNHWVARFFYPLLNFFQALGGVAFAPLVVVWFGFSIVGLGVVVDYTMIFPMIFSTLVGVSTVPRVYVDGVRTLGAGRLAIVRGVIIPGAMPNILLGLRLAIAYGWRSLIAVEMLFLLDGLGFMIFDARQSFNTSLIILGMIEIGLLWFITDELLVKPLEGLTIQRWGMVHR